MNKNIYFLFISMLLTSSAGCSTLSNRQKSIATIVGAGLVGGAVGYVTAPEGTLPIAHAGLWAGASAATAAVASLFIFDSEKDKEVLSEKNKKLDLENKELKASLEPQLVEVIPESQFSQMPSEIAKVVRPGKWARYLIAPKQGGVWVPEKMGSTWFKRSEMLIYVKGEMLGDPSGLLGTALMAGESDSKESDSLTRSEKQSEKQNVVSQPGGNNSAQSIGNQNQSHSTQKTEGGLAESKVTE